MFFFGYHAQVALPIMHYEQRFLYPALPALLLVGARGMQLTWAHLNRHPVLMSLNAKGVRGLLALGLAVGCFAAFVGPTLETWANVPDTPTPQLKVKKEWELRYKNYWYALDRVSTLPDGVVIATTEVGRPGAMNPGKTIVDLGGLNEPAFAMEGYSGDVLFHRYQPDLIYLPHPDYKELSAQIQNDARFREGYEYFPGGSLPIPSVMGVAIRKGSPHYPGLAAAFGKP